MAQSYRQIPSRLARQLKLIMADVDGTLTAGGDSISLAVSKVVRSFEEQGVAVGLVSGRTLARLESLAQDLGITGPIIAENGGVAKLKVKSELVDLGYSRQPALEALEKLKALYSDAIQEREDNKDRLVDVVMWSHGVEVEELQRHLGKTQLLDSGYILHLLQEGISKGRTLIRLLGKIADGNLSLEDIMVFGDSPTDMSLFKLFPHSVLIINPMLPAEKRRVLKQAAKYVSSLPFGDGFAEVASHILSARAGES